MIDLERICCTDNVRPSDWQNVAIEIRKNLHEVGFMYLINHGVPQDIVRPVCNRKEFFLIINFLDFTTSRLQRTLKSVKTFSHFQEKRR